MYSNIISMILEAARGGDRAATICGMTSLAGSRKASASDPRRYQLWLNVLTSLGRHHCSTSDLRAFFSVLRMAIDTESAGRYSAENTATPLTGLSPKVGAGHSSVDDSAAAMASTTDRLAPALTSLAAMSKRSRGLAAYFSFHNFRSSMRIPNIKSFPANGYTFVAWLRLDDSAVDDARWLDPEMPDGASEIHGRMDMRMSRRVMSTPREVERRRGHYSMIYRFAGDAGNGCECAMYPAVGEGGKKCMRVVLRTLVSGKSRERECEVPLGECDIPLGEWCQFAVVSRYALLWRSSVTLYVNGDEKFSTRIRYPDAKKMRSGVCSGKIGGFSGQLGPVCMLSATLKASEIRQLYDDPLSLGPSASKSDAPVVSCARFDPTVEPGITGALHDVRAAIDRANEAASKNEVLIRAGWRGAWVDLPILQKYQILFAFDSRNLRRSESGEAIGRSNRRKSSKSSSHVAFDCGPMGHVATLDGDVIGVECQSVGDAFAACGGVWRAVLPILVSTYRPARRFVPFTSSPLRLPCVRPAAFAAAVSVVANVCRHSATNMTNLKKESGVRLLSCLLRHCPSKMLTMSLWWSCNELVEAIYDTDWAEAKLASLAACRMLLLPSLKIWGRASFHVQRNMWKAVSHNLRRAQDRAFCRPHDRADASFESSDTVCLCTPLRDCLLYSLSHFQNMIAELQPWGTYALPSTAAATKEEGGGGANDTNSVVNDDDANDDTTSVGQHLSRRQKIVLRHDLVGVANQIVRETYISTSSSKNDRASEIAGVVQSVISLIIPDEYDRNERRARGLATADVANKRRTGPEDGCSVAGNRAAAEDPTTAAAAAAVTAESPKGPLCSKHIEDVPDEAYLAPLSILSNLLASPDPVPGDKIAESTAAVRTACAEKLHGSAWRSGMRNAPHLEPLIGTGEALTMLRCLKKFDLTADIYEELRGILLAEDLRFGADPINYALALWSSQTKAARSGEDQLRDKDAQVDALRGRRVVVSAMFKVLLELLPCAKPSLQLAAFRDLEAVLMSGGPHAKVSQENRNDLRSHTAWQRWFLFFIVSNKTRGLSTDTSKRGTPPPPPTDRSIDRMRAFIDRLRVSSLPQTVRNLMSDALKKKDSAYCVEVLQNAVYDPETPIRVCMAAAEIVETHFRYSADDVVPRGLVAEVALALFSAVIGDWFAMEEAQVCLELLGPTWGLTQAEAMGGWELRGLLRRLMSKAESVICEMSGGSDGSSLPLSPKRRKNAGMRQKSLNVRGESLYRSGGGISRGSRRWIHLVNLCKICTDVMLMSLLQHKGDVGGTQSRRHVKHTPEAMFGAGTHHTRLGVDGLRGVGESTGGRSTLAVLLDVWALLIPQLRGIGDDGEALSKSQSVLTSALQAISAAASSAVGKSQREHRRPRHEGGCLWRVAQLELGALAPSVARCAHICSTEYLPDEDSKVGREAALVAAEISLRRFNALCVQIFDAEAVSSSASGESYRARAPDDREEVARVLGRTKTRHARQIPLYGTVLAIWAVKRLDAMRHQIVRSCKQDATTAKDATLLLALRKRVSHVALLLWNAQRKLLKSISQDPALTEAEKVLLSTATEPNVDPRLMSLTARFDSSASSDDLSSSSPESVSERNASKIVADTTAVDKEGDDGAVVSRYTVKIPVEKKDGHFESNSNATRAGARHGAKSLAAFLSCETSADASKLFNHYNSKYWSALANHLGKGRDRMESRMRRMRAGEAIARVKAMQIECSAGQARRRHRKESTSQVESMMSFSVFRSNDANTILHQRHENAKDWRDMRDQIRSHAVSNVVSLWFECDDGDADGTISSRNNAWPWKMLDQHEDPCTRSRVRLARNWDGHDYAGAAYAESRKGKKHMTVAKRAAAKSAATASRIARLAAASAFSVSLAASDACLALREDAETERELEMEQETRAIITSVLESCVATIAREESASEHARQRSVKRLLGRINDAKGGTAAVAMSSKVVELASKTDSADQDDAVAMPSDAALMLHMEEMLHGEEGESIVYATEAEIVFPMSVVRGTLEVSNWEITFHPERFSGPNNVDAVTMEGDASNSVLWVPDRARSACSLCGDPFRQLIGTGKHHCRSCGDIFCEDCSLHKLALPKLGYIEPVRVCDACFEKRTGAHGTLAADLLAGGDASSTAATFDTKSRGSASQTSLDDIAMLRYHRWPLRNIRAVHRRRYLLQMTALEFFFYDERSFLLHFLGNNEAIRVLEKILTITGGIRQLVPHLALARNAGQLLSQYALATRPEALLHYADAGYGDWTRRWRHWEMSTFEYLMKLNTAAGRTYNDLSQYPVMPWILSDYTSKTIDLKDPS
eukprot:g4412.t1